MKRQSNSGSSYRLAARPGITILGSSRRLEPASRQGLSVGYRYKPGDGESVLFQHLVFCLANSIIGFGIVTVHGLAGSASVMFVIHSLDDQSRQTSAESGNEFN